MLKVKSKTTSRFLPYILLGIGTFITTLGGLYLWSWYIATHGASEPPNPSVVVTYSTDNPSETKPVGEYIVAADQPRSIKITKIGSGGFIQKVGTDQDKRIAVPTNIHFAGWYRNSVKPGEKGLSIIDGHVGGRYSSAIFSKLSSINNGDEISIEYGNGSIRLFKVIDKQSLALDKSADFLFQKRKDVDYQLNLVTCDGTYNKKAKTFNNRLIIVAKRTR